MSSVNTFLERHYVFLRQSGYGHDAALRELEKHHRKPIVSSQKEEKQLSFFHNTEAEHRKQWSRR